jgi:hypothetical protein
VRERTDIEVAILQNGLSPGVTVNRPSQVLFASLIGTTIEFFDFYIYATAAVLVFPKLFFPASDPASARLASLATFAIAFLARPTRRTCRAIRHTSTSGCRSDYGRSEWPAVQIVPVESCCLSS